MPGLRTIPLRALAAATPIVFAAHAASAYVGPGAGVTAIGTVLALAGALVLALIGFVWYPIKRLVLRRAPAKQSDPASGREL